MADWPEATELAQVLNVDNFDDWETTLERVMASAIAKVKLDVGAWDEDVDVPDDALAQAALRLAELLSQRADAVDWAVRDVATAALDRDPTYRRLLFGHRRRFGIA